MQVISGNHRFALGNVVHIKEPRRINAAPGPYEVIAQLPEREGELQYRLKSLREPYDRIIKEDQLASLQRLEVPGRLQ